MRLTHIYVYVKDNYSFNDSKEGTQYLGHWNKTGVTLVFKNAATDLLKGRLLRAKPDARPHVEKVDQWERLFGGAPLDKPVDARRGWSKLRGSDVYYPVYNETYQAWRNLHQRGGDFMIHSDARLVKLAKPIELTLETVCRPANRM